MEINRETQELLSAINLSPQDLKEISTTFLNLPRGWRLFSAGDAPIYVVLADRFRSSDREKLNPREPSYLYVIQTETQLSSTWVGRTPKDSSSR